MAGLDLPSRAIREQIASAINLIVHLQRFRDGSRRITHVTEVSGMEGEVITLTELYAFDYGAGIGADGRFLGGAVATGVRPHFSDHLAELGIELPSDIFGETDLFRAARQ